MAFSLITAPFIPTATPISKRYIRSGPPTVRAFVLQYVTMSNTLTIRLPEELLERLREKARCTGLPMGRVVRESLETALSKDKNKNKDAQQAWRKYAGIIKGGPSDVSSRKGFSRG
jgi:predicted DNA-binding protein